MDSLLFSGRSIWTMVHGIVLGGGALMALAIALFSLHAMHSADDAGVVAQRQSRHLALATTFAAGALWLTIIIGTYVSFPAYRATPPEGLTDLAAYPRALLRADPGTAWLHSFAMEIKEHVPMIAAMLATAVAFVVQRYRAAVLTDARLNRMATSLLAIAFVLAAGVGLLGILINKVAPLE